MEKRIVELYEKYNETCKKYEKNFGEDTLKRCIVHLVHPIYATVEDLNESIEMLEKAIESGDELPQLSEEEYKNIVF